DDRQWNNGFLAQNKNIQGIIILGKSLRDKSVIRRIVDRRIKNTIKANQAAGLVEFVFNARPERNLDNAVKFLRQLVSGSNVVPGMNHGYRSRFILAESRKTSPQRAQRITE